jgi:hypothetical protein
MEIIRLGLIALTPLFIASCNFTLISNSCSLDECEQITRSNAGTLYSDPETGISTAGATIYRLHDENAFLYPVQIDSTVLPRISSDQALRYLSEAHDAAARPYHLCDYHEWEKTVIFSGASQPLPFNKLRIIPAHGTIFNDENYVVFLWYSPGPSLIFTNVTCIAYRRLAPPGQLDPAIASEMEAVTEALISLGATFP